MMATEISPDCLKAFMEYSAIMNRITSLARRISCEIHMFSTLLVLHVYWGNQCKTMCFIRSLATIKQNQNSYKIHPSGSMTYLDWWSYDFYEC